VGGATARAPELGGGREGADSRALCGRRGPFPHRGRGTPPSGAHRLAEGARRCRKGDRQTNGPAARSALGEQQRGGRQAPEGERVKWRHRKREAICVLCCSLMIISGGVRRRSLPRTAHDTSPVDEHCVALRRRRGRRWGHPDTKGSSYARAGIGTGKRQNQGLSGEAVQGRVPPTAGREAHLGGH